LLGGIAVDALMANSRANATVFYELLASNNYSGSFSLNPTEP
jgi:hypothetical protein